MSEAMSRLSHAGDDALSKAFLYHLLWKPFTVSDLIFGPESKPHAVALLGTIFFLVSLVFASAR